MNWQSIIRALVTALVPVLEQWFITWLNGVLPTLATDLPAPAEQTQVNKLLLLTQARATLYFWQFQTKARVDEAIALVKAGKA